MNKIRQFFICVVFGLSCAVSAQENEPETSSASTSNLTAGYIVDDLYVYMLAGSGKNYRILGTVIAGSQIKLTGLSENGYSQIIDDKNRTTWVETKYLSKKSGLRFVVAELNAQLASATDLNNQLDSQVNTLKSSLSSLNDKSSQLNNDIATLKNQLAGTQAKLKSQDTDVQKQWFFAGAIVLGIGLILGLILPKLTSRKRSSSDSWT